MFDYKKYVQDAIRTESRVEKAETNIALFRGAMDAANAVTEIFDALKKNIYYGREINNDILLSHVLSLYIANSAILTSLGSRAVQGVIPVDPRVLHAVVGKFTEAGEMLQAIDNSILDDAPLDVVNMKEEFGDDKWYDAILCDALAIDMQAVCDTNIAKLRARYPDKFTAEAANNRDLENERKVLEGSDSTAEGCV